MKAQPLIVERTLVIMKNAELRSPPCISKFTTDTKRQ